MPLPLPSQVEAVMRGSSDRKLTMTEQSMASLMGGTLSALSTIPFDVLVATFQQASKAGQVCAPVLCPTSRLSRR